MVLRLLVCHVRDKREATGAGMDVYILEPVQKGDLAQVLEKYRPEAL
jgi:hypothetical protein